MEFGALEHADDRLLILFTVVIFAFFLASGIMLIIDYINEKKK